MDATEVAKATIPGERQVPLVWQKASVVAGLWASLEIILGSFLHNLKIPFGGSLLAAISVVIVVGFQMMWPLRGMIWRAGILCALMKSVSPSALILGPMIGIMTEALLMELAIRILGRNPLGYVAGGILAVSSALVHKVLSLLILYGFNIVQVYVNLFHFLMKQVGWEGFTFWQLMGVLVLIYMVLGFGASLLGMMAGRKALQRKESWQLEALTERLARNGDYFRLSENQRFSMVWFVFHLVFLPVSLYLSSLDALRLALPLTLGYIVVVSLRYPGGLRRLKKTMFWVQILILLLFSSLFWKSAHPADFQPQWSGLIIGLTMMIRAILIVAVFSCLSIELRNPVVRKFLHSKGYDPLYQSLTLSFSALPVMIGSLASPGQFLRHPVTSFSGIFLSGDSWLKMMTDGEQPDNAG